MSHEQSIEQIFFYIAKQHPELLNKIASTSNNFADFEKELGFRGTFYYSKDTHCELAALCDKYGSDKGELTSAGHPYPWPSHSYTDYYKRLWGHCRYGVRRVFECGLGTNTPNLASSMGAYGKPGASLRVWRDYFPQAHIYGADIDRDILFSENRIETFYVNQLNPASISELWAAIGQEKFQFMIDDGLHAFEAGSCLFTHSIEKLDPDGIYVIEDVTQKDLRRYKTFFADKRYVVDYVTLYRPGVGLGDNNIVVVRKR